MVSEQLNTKFALKYRISNSGMPVNVKFNRKYFVRPTNLTQEGKDSMLSLETYSTGINNSPQKEPTSMSVIEKLLMDALSVK